MRILDIGCGPGTITADLAALVPDGHVVGIDNGAEVIAKAGSTAASRGITNVDFLVGDAHALDFQDQHFDVVHAHQVLQHIGDPSHALREWRRVTKPGGMIACREADSSSTAFYPDIDGIGEFCDVYRKAARSRGGEPDGGRHLVTWVREAGFERRNIQTTASVWCFSNPEERAYWSGMWIDRLSQSALPKNMVEGGHCNKEDLDRYANAWRSWGAHDDSWL